MDSLDGKSGESRASDLQYESAAITDEQIIEGLGVSEDDIPYEVACRAHTGTSMSPEVRAESERSSYVSDLVTNARSFLEQAKDREERDLIWEQLLRYKDAHLKRKLAYLQSRNGLVSTMIV